MSHSTLIQLLVKSVTANNLAGFSGFFLNPENYIYAWIFKTSSLYLIFNTLSCNEQIPKNLHAFSFYSFQDGSRKHLLRGYRLEKKLKVMEAIKSWKHSNTKQLVLFVFLEGRRCFHKWPFYDQASVKYSRWNSAKVVNLNFVRANLRRGLRIKSFQYKACLGPVPLYIGDTIQ